MAIDMNMNKIKILCPLFLLIFLSSGYLFSQKSQVFEDEDLHFKNGLEYFNKQKYAIAQEYFKNIIQSSNNGISDIIVDAKYYNAICALELFHDNSEFLISEFIKSHPEHPRTRMAYFQMGRFNYRQKQYDDAIYWFRKINKYDLEKEDLEEFYFKMGYSYFSKGDIVQAEKLFYELMEGETAYSSPAIYYYSHIAYERKNYETALKGFEKIKDDETFKLLVPYYVAQIYYVNEKYEKAIEYAEELAQSESVKREAEINRIIGESYFKLNKYEESLSYLEAFKDKAESYSRNDIFQLAFVYYKTEDFEKAAKTFSLITNNTDTLTQQAYYYIADCYLQTDDKNSARLSFQNAARFNFLPQIKEDAMYQFAKLTYDLSFSPFNETINAFQSYIDENPKSPRVDEAYDYLMKVFLSAKNYQGALNAIEKMQQKSFYAMKAYQRVAYFRGLELLNNLNFIESIEAFTISLDHATYDRQLKALALYWRAEAYFRLKDYNNSITDINELLITPGAFSLPEYKLANYNLAYSYFNKKDYMQAALTFRKFIESYLNKSDKRFGDALIRVGDSYFISKDYRRAIEFYAKVDTSNSYDKDYALFQEGFSQGLLKNNLRKSEILMHLLNDTTSNYFDDALFELANSYIALDSSQLALNAYYQLLDNFPNSSYSRKALVQTALLEYNLNILEKSLEHYKTVINNYPGSTEAQEALIGIKNVYVELNDVDSYFAYVQTLGDIVDVSENEQDQLVYQAAENVYMTGDCEKAVDAFQKYLIRFSNGQYVLNANYYIAECYFAHKKLDSAVVLFDNILNEKKNTFTEQALINAAEINFVQKNFNNALNKYLVLEEIAEVKANLIEARMGQLKAADSLNNYQIIIISAHKVLKTDKIDAEYKRKSRYLLANAYRELNIIDSALIHYRTLALDVKNSEGAESKYIVSSILYDQGKMLLAEREIFDFVDANTPHQYWLAKSFLVLAQIYLDKEDVFQAKATLNSIIQNYESETDGIIEEAKATLLEITGEEDQQFEQEEEEIKIKF
jgi:TolA-binding protein